MKLIAGIESEYLAKKISDHLNIPLVEREIYNFRDGEIYVNINENIRGEEVFIIQSLGRNPNDKIMGLLILADALRNASVKKSIAILPYLAYSRQDRRTEPRTSISARVLARLIESVWIQHVVALDLHTSQIQGFFNIPVDNIYTVPFFAKYIQQRFPNIPTICAPDIGGVIRSRGLAKALITDLTILDKRRTKPGESKILHVLGDPVDKDIIIYDDIIDSAGTVCHAADKLIEFGAKSVRICATHGLFSHKAVEHIMESHITEVITTDSIAPTEATKACTKIHYVSITEILAEAIQRIISHKSLINWTRIG